MFKFSRPQQKIIKSQRREIEKLRQEIEQLKGSSKPKTNDRFAKYQKMKKTGLEQGAILQCAQRDGITLPTDFFSENPAEQMIPEQTIPKQIIPKKKQPSITKKKTIYPTLKTISPSRYEIKPPLYWVPLNEIHNQSWFNQINEHENINYQFLDKIPKEEDDDEQKPTISTKPSKRMTFDPISLAEGKYNRIVGNRTVDDLSDDDVTEIYGIIDKLKNIDKKQIYGRVLKIKLSNISVMMINIQKIRRVLTWLNGDDWIHILHVVRNGGNYINSHNETLKNIVGFKCKRGLQKIMEYKHNYELKQFLAGNIGIVPNWINIVVTANEVNLDNVKNFITEIKDVEIKSRVVKNNTDIILLENQLKTLEDDISTLLRNNGENCEFPEFLTTVLNFLEWMNPIRPMCTRCKMKRIYI